MSSASLVDAAARAAALDVRRSFLVQAPAGSGKTELLMQRYLRALAAPNVEEPEAILAITFTRKAALEMRNRILDALTRAAAGEALSQAPHEQVTRQAALAVLRRDRERQWGLLANPSRLVIRTIDSFCDALVRGLPLASAISGETQVTESPDVLYDEAARRTLLELTGEGARADAVGRLLAEQDNDAARARRLIVTMLQRRDQWLRFLGRSDAYSQKELEVARANLERSLRDAVESELTEIQAVINSRLDDEARQMLLAHAAQAGLNVEDEHELAVLRGLHRWPAASAEHVQVWQALSTFALTGKPGEGKLRRAFDKRVGMPGGLPERAACIEFFRKLAGRDWCGDLCGALDRVRVLPPVTYSEREWEFVLAMFGLLPVAVGHLKAVFAEEGTSDFSEVAMAAERVLGKMEGPSDLAFALGCRIRHILVDEFQDTSRSQTDLLKALVRTWEPEDGCTLFLVGDPQQSIYAFRQADVLNFSHAAKRGVGPVKPAVERLKVNFRSQPKLVEWFNRTFPHILTEESETRAAVRYVPAESAPGAANTEGAAVRLLGFDSGDPARRDEASVLADCIQDELGADSSATLAILVRSRTHLPELTAALRARRIRYRALEIDPLHELPAVRDVDCVRRALLHRADRVAWLALLRAPFIGLTLSDLAALCRESHGATICELLSARLAMLSEEGGVRAPRLRELMEATIARLGRVPLDALVESAWLRLGGEAALRGGDDGEQEWQAVKMYMSLLRECEAGGAPTDGPEFDRALAKLYAPPETGEGIRVEIMTIHGAKGLEWDVVFVPALGRPPRRGERQLLYWRARQVGEDETLLLAPAEAIASEAEKRERTVAAYVRQLQKEAETEEVKRLLYVAATRARRRLYLSAELPAEGKPPLSNTFLKLLWCVPGIPEAFERPVQPTEPQPGEPPSPWRRLPADWRLPEPPTPLQWKHAMAEPGAEHTFEWVGAMLPRVGTVAHAWLQQIAREGPDAWNERRLMESRASWRVALLREGVSPAELPQALQRLEDALRRTLADERGRWLLSSHEDARSELELTGVEEGEFRSRRIDRTFVADGVRWIVDFKTSTHEGGDLEHFLTMQKEKYRDDLARYARLMRCRDQQHPIRCALYFPLLQRFVEVAT